MADELDHFLFRLVVILGPDPMDGTFVTLVNHCHEVSCHVFLHCGAFFLTDLLALAEPHLSGALLDGVVQRIVEDIHDLFDFDEDPYDELVYDYVDVVLRRYHGVTIFVNLVVLRLFS